MYCRPCLGHVPCSQRKPASQPPDAPGRGKQVPSRSNMVQTVVRSLPGCRLDRKSLMPRRREKAGKADAASRVHTYPKETTQEPECSYSNVHCLSCFICRSAGGTASILASDGWFLFPVSPRSHREISCHRSCYLVALLSTRAAPRWNRLLRNGLRIA